MILQDIFIYPIKSLGGIRLTEAQVEIPGLSLDRRWMLVDANGVFLTQRKHSRMALLRVELSGNGLTVYNKEDAGQAHFIPFEPESEEWLPVRVWQDEVRAKPVSARADRWFSEMLQIPCRLVYMASSSKRYVEGKYAVNRETLSFADAMPYLIIGQGSLDDLNGRLEEPLPMNRFRPSLVFSGGKAFEEDRWDRVKIGECVFKVTKPCARCVITTIDQETGIAGKEPLKTLAKFRSEGNKVLFGQNMIALTTGKVKVGDPVRMIGS